MRKLSPLPGLVVATMTAVFLGPAAPAMAAASVSGGDHHHHHYHYHCDDGWNGWNDDDCGHGHYCVDDHCGYHQNHEYDCDERHDFKYWGAYQPNFHDDDRCDRSLLSWR